MPETLERFGAGRVLGSLDIGGPQPNARAPLARMCVYIYICVYIYVYREKNLPSVHVGIKTLAQPCEVPAEGLGVEELRVPELRV